ncbi:hypothetical protein GQF61_14820 [Sphingobacterium sp. DK4209]|uniref:Peptidase M1 membrane alanine aminopeptidase domain-containing protein n=1 Tax=Sphingobacterium zhuxiongii TaxID=2662364 RepID=A0A5Q0QE27_9SPHI|nr:MULTISPECIES: M1 family aminopeptidase [unclassified Sphingobacterium]MVZ67132.1 hypothetical protein [Sphingobacterium sp. DK4209]QGA25998.1 hypothetical protein GFH32_06560 [Sphingobacterium sp. dk4302]
MFSTIFTFEVTRWFKQPVFYIYCAIYFALAYFTTISSLGAFDGVTVTTSSPIMVNSPINVAGYFNSFSTFIYFLLPTVVGAAVYRDYLYNVHNLLFSYPLDKFKYLSAKFFAAIVIVCLIAILTVVGFYAAQYHPGINTSLLGPNRIEAYLSGFLIVVLPNFLLFGSMIFALVTFSRNIYIGFVFVLVLLLLQSVLDIATQNADNRYLVALLDPFGFQPITYYTKYWSIDEQNNNLLPLTGVLLYNRLIWSGLAIVILTVVYYSFSFSQQGFSFRRAKSADRITKNNFGSIIRIDLPKVAISHSFFSNLKMSWRLSNVDFKYVVKNWTFAILIIIAALFVLAIMSSSSMLFGTTTYPVTWQVLESMGGIYSFFLIIMIMLFAGMLVQRDQQSNMKLLVDSTSVPNWVLLFSKYLALMKMTVVVLFISMLTGIVYQAYNGYYNFEFGHYLYELFVLDYLKYLVLIGFALFIHGFFRNYFIGFIVCLLIVLGIPFLSKIGVEQLIYKFNNSPKYHYSDMNGYADIRHYLYYRLYWLLFSGVLFALTLLFWRRGILSSVKDRMQQFTMRLKPAIVVPAALSLIAFIGLGYSIYYVNNVVSTRYSNKETELQQVSFERKYKHFEKLPSPRLVSVFTNVDIDPKQRNFTAKGDFVYVNKTTLPIDSLFMGINSSVKTNIKIERAIKKSQRDTVLDVNVYQFEQPLMPGDTLRIQYQLTNLSNTFLHDRSIILENGTFFNNTIFPILSYADHLEIDDNSIREKYKLAPRDRMADPRDSSKLGNTYISNDADWIDFEAIVSTSADQIAIAPGYLQKDWVENGKHYYHYKMDSPILNFYSFISAKYEVKREKVNGKNMEIYYHKGHEYNIDRMMASIKKSLGYYESHFSPYQFNQLRIIEFPSSHGTFAQAFANTVPFSESIGFIAKVDEDNPDAVDYAYAVVAHEFAHQWWAHQVIGANVKGATMMSESLSEYSSLKVLEQTYGKGQMRKFLKEALDNYLVGRSNEKLKENPLMFNENQQYIHYNKGSLVMYAMSDYLGEEVFSDVLQAYIKKTAFQYPPYTTSIEFVDLLKQHTPDSLQYLIKDMYETVTIYDNAVEEAEIKPLKGGKYEVSIDFKVSKYRTDDKGKRSYEDVKGSKLSEKMNAKDKKAIESLPLKDYVDVVVFGEAKKQGKYEVENPLLEKRVKIDRIKNRLTFVVNQKPISVGVDPYNKLIDTDSDDNRHTF